MMFRLRWIGRLVLLVMCLAAGDARGEPQGDASAGERSAGEVGSPLEPEQALGHFHLDEGLAIELVACEPEVVDPIALRFDELGQMWVVEMRDYPHGPADGLPPLSRIRVLTDTDGDGRYETARTFAEELLFPTGLQPWQGGVIVTLAGEVAYLKDTTGDGRADLHETWYRGFVAENPQLRANHPRLALDGRVYVANGLRGGKVENLRQAGGELVEISGRDFRFDPRTGDCEAVSGNGQFGLALDDFGRRFVCSNRQPLDHVVLENHYLARNPLAAIGAVLQPVAAAGEKSRVFPLTAAWTTSNLHAGQFTAACGIVVYNGTALPPEYRGNGFTCEPTGSLVHRERLAPAGATFTASPATPGREFLASTDEWFRPVNLEVGPDGALYVVDMYRAVIEHPEFMPAELQQRPDLRLGDDRGRIYRIVPRDWRRPPAAVGLAELPNGDLAVSVAHENVWQRETAARLLIERQNVAAVGELDRLAETSSEPAARAACLGTLAALEELSDARILAALADADARVREQAVLLAESRMSVPEIHHRVLQLADDDDARLRFQVALSLGASENEQAIEALAKIASRDAGDVWTRRAVASAVPKFAAPLAGELLKRERTAPSPVGGARLEILRELAAIVGAGLEADAIAAIFESGLADDVPLAARIALVVGVQQGCQRRGAELVELLARDKPQIAARLQTLFEQAARELLSDDPARQALAVESLAVARHEAASQTLLRIVHEHRDQSLRTQAAAALARHPSGDVASSLLQVYGQQTPQVRAAIRDALVVQADNARQLIEAVRDGQLARAELGASIESRLKQHRDADVRNLATEVLTSQVPAERRQVLADYQQSLALSADPVAGKELFRQQCATCHQIGDVGVNVAPDISDSRVKTPAQLLTDILNPNQAIDANYVSYTVVTADGNVHSGLIAAETASAVTLRQPENKTVTLLRADIESIRSSGVSLMPEGFEKHLSHQQMADLISFVKNWRYLKQPIPGTLGAAGEP